MLYFRDQILTKQMPIMMQIYEISSHTHSVIAIDNSTM